MLRDIVPEKIVQKRGERSRKAIAEASGGVVTEQDLYCYEKNLHRPSMKKLPYLLKGLGVKYEEITEPVELAVS